MSIHIIRIIATIRCLARFIARVVQASSALPRHAALRQKLQLPREFRERSCTYGVNQNGVHILTTTHVVYQKYTDPYHVPNIWTRLVFARYAHGFLRELHAR